jgi:hypothetical protein
MQRKIGTTTVVHVEWGCVEMIEVKSGGGIGRLLATGPAPGRGRVAALVDIHWMEICEARKLRWEWAEIAESLGVSRTRWKSVAAAYRRCSQKRKEQEVSHVQ